MNKLLDKTTGFPTSIILIIFLTFLLLMYLSGNMSFKKGVYDKG